MVVVFVPPLFVSVPALLNATAAPPPKASVLSLAKVHVFPAALLTMAAFCMFRTPFAPDHCVAPLLFRVRKASTSLAEAGKFTPALALVVAFEPAWQELM